MIVKTDYCETNGSFYSTTADQEPISSQVWSLDTVISTVNLDSV